MVSYALVSSCLDYANSVLCGITQQNTSKLQKVQHLLAHATASSFHSSSQTLLQQLLWLPAKYCINFKITKITFCTLHSSQPAYHPPCMFVILLILSGCHTNLLSVLFTCTSSGIFSIPAPKILNSFPSVLRMCTCPDTFCCHLKTYYFQLASQSP